MLATKMRECNKLTGRTLFDHLSSINGSYFIYECTAQAFLEMN